MSEIEKVISDLELIKASIEWEEPLDYQIMIDNAIQTIRELQNQNKQIRDEVIDELITNALDCDNCYVSIYQLKKIGRRMKGEQNE